MPKIDVYDVNGKKVDTLELSEQVFGIEPNEAMQIASANAILCHFLAFIVCTIRMIAKAITYIILLYFTSTANIKRSPLGINIVYLEV